MTDKYKILYVVKERDLKSSTSTEVNNLYAAMERGHEPYIVFPQDFFVDKGELKVIGRRPNALKLKDIFEYQHYLETRLTLNDDRIPVSEFDIVFSRSVPIVQEERGTDEATLTYLKTMKTMYPNVAFVNDPDAISRAGSKIYDSIVLSEFTPVTHVTKDERRLTEILMSGTNWIAKPLDELGGVGIIGIDKGQYTRRNITPFLQILLRDPTSSTRGTKPYVIQGTVEGLERRLVVLGGKLLTSYGKIPDDDDQRGNLDAGAKFIPFDPQQGDLELVEKMSPLLVNEGLHLVALDVIGPEKDGTLENTKLIELNARCPQWQVGLASQTEAFDVAKKVIEYSEKLYRKINGK